MVVQCLLAPTGTVAVTSPMRPHTGNPAVSLNPHIPGVSSTAEGGQLWSQGSPSSAVATRQTTGWDRVAWNVLLTVLGLADAGSGAALLHRQPSSLCPT